MSADGALGRDANRDRRIRSAATRRRSAASVDSTASGAAGTDSGATGGNNARLIDMELAAAVIGGGAIGTKGDSGEGTAGTPTAHGNPGRVTIDSGG